MCLNPLPYFFVIAGSAVVPKERVSAKTILGARVICLGTFVFNLNRVM